MRYFKSLLLIFILFASGSVVAEDDFNSSFEVIKPADFDGSFDIESAEDPELKHENNTVLFSFTASVQGLKEDQPIKLRIFDEDWWADEGIQRKSVTGFKGEKAVLTNTARNNDSFDILVTESNTYHLIEMTSTSTIGFYDINGECKVALNPGNNDLEQDNCDNTKQKYANILTKNLHIVVSIGFAVAILLFLLYRVTNFLITKYLIYRINQLTEKTLDIDDEEVRNKALSQITEADSSALEGEYITAFRILRKIEIE